MPEEKNKPYQGIKTGEPSPAAFFFAPDGPLSGALKNFEPRKQQEAMAGAVYSAVGEKKHLIVEAGTGVGKSLAYLLPAALWAVRNKKKAVVATYTKALQEQLTKKDLPVVKAMLQNAGLELKYFLLMGSSNYLCLARLCRCAERGAGLFDDEEARKTAEDLLEWSKTCVSGCRTEVPFRVCARVWEEACRDPDICLGRRCSFKEDCLYRKDVAKAKQADLIVVNQHLYFAGIPIPAFDAVIFDEAHNLEDVASNFFGFSLTDRQIKRLLDDVFNARSGKGLAKRLRRPPAKWLDEVKDAVRDAHFASKLFFQDIAEKTGLVRRSLSEGGLNGAGGGFQAKARRVREPGIVENPLSGPLTELGGLLSGAVGHSQTDLEELEIKAHHNRCQQITGQLNSFLKCESKEHAYWVEVKSARRNPVISLNKAPVEVADSLRKELFEAHCPVILTSATLAAGGSFKMLRSRLGVDNASELLLDSPFEYEKQAVIYMPADIPDPKDAAEYERAVIGSCPEIAAAVEGGIFILYTNWQLLEKSFRNLAGAITGRPLFRQGEKPPQQLLADFKKAGNGILLATDTFWQGIDVPGSALSCVVITRLPFLSPDTPLEEARQEWMAAKGIDVFSEYSLPKAIVKFRQGFGRLIRSGSDFGAVIVLDPRIKTRRYGAMFLRSVPKCRRLESLKEIKEFFSSRKPGAQLSK
ncbi:MAG: ATP-dependent DNA helicase [Elusimicrobia bacterium]|nr:ATP-dependent DNA helicase [Elusimicrobiota bacterium]